MGQEIKVHRLTNGMILLVEVMDWVESASFTIALPAGCTRDPEEKRGLANFACEMVQRGCGDLDSRQFLEALERLGADHSSSATAAHTSYSAAMLAENLVPTLEVHASLVRQPQLPAEQLEDARSVCILEIDSLEDDLAQRTVQELKSRIYPKPYGRSSSGLREGVEAVGLEDVVEFVATNYLPHDAVLSVAGNIEFASVVDHVERLFGDWQTVPQPEVSTGPPVGGYHHIPHDSSQTHIAIAYESVPYRHEDYFQSRGAVGVLSDGMSSRLFTEVRENRGLCYTVFAVYNSLRDEGRVISYAGTSTDRAQESLDVMLAELQRLGEGIDDSELRRLKARVRSALIMQQEISSARAGSMAADWYHLGRVRTMDEVSAIIDGLTCESINTFLSNHPPRNFQVVTLGEKPLEVSLEVS